MGLFGSKQKHDLEEKPMEMTVRHAVSKLRDEIEHRNDKIQGKIQGLEAESVSGKSIIDGLMNDLVAFEMAGDDNGQAETEKKLRTLRDRQDDIQARIQAYRNALSDASFIKPRLKEIFDLATKIQEQRVQELHKQTSEMTRLQKEIEILKEQAKKMEGIAPLYYRETQKDKDAIASLLPFIENRAIEQPIPFLEAFARGATPETLELYLVQPKQEWTLPYQQPPVVVESTRVPRQVTQTEARNLMRSEHFNAGFTPVE